MDLGIAHDLFENVEAAAATLGARATATAAPTPTCSTPIRRSRSTVTSPARRA
jgi:hypothetical protein